MIPCTSKETLERKNTDGIHKAMYSLLTWLLEQNSSVLQAFWNNLSKEYNQESYPKLQNLFANLPKGTLLLVIFIYSNWSAMKC